MPNPDRYAPPLVPSAGSDRDHWFDRVTKSLAAGAVSRRQLLTRGAVAGWAAGLGLVHPRMALAQSPAPIAPPSPIPPSRIPPPPNPVPVPSHPACVRRTAAGNTGVQLSVASGGLTFELQLSQQAKKISSSVITITKGQTLLLKVTATATGAGASTAAVTYGAGFTGVRSASVKSANGKAFQGSIDGRAFTTSEAPRSMAAVKFADGRPPPQVVADPGLDTAIMNLVKQAQASLRSCTTAPTVPLRPVLPLMTPREVGQNGDPGLGWYEPGETYQSPNCTKCWDDCVNLGWQDSGLADWETYLCVPCLVAADIAYNAIILACWGVCQLPGGGCCPVPCGGAFICCGSGDNCFHSDLCCPGNMVVCRDVCCGDLVTSCAPDGYCGCPSGQIVCGDNCCPPGNICCGNQCYPGGSDVQCCGDGPCPVGQCQPGNVCCPPGKPICKGVCCADGVCDRDGNCCPPPSHMCGGACCAPFNACCNNVCCPDNAICVGNTCCPTGQVCGRVCCPAGHSCANPATGTCSACPAGRSPVICENTASGAVSSACCPPNVACCNGQCCQAASDNFGKIVCCYNVSGDTAPYNTPGYGCHHISACTE